MLLTIAVFLLVAMAITQTTLQESTQQAIKFLLVAGACSLIVFATVATAQEAPYYHMPDRTLTPGLIASTDVALICKKDYPAKARKVSSSLRDKIYLAHKVDKKKCRGDCKIDHLVPLAVGGSNDPKNLWPHEYGAEYTVYEKTRLEVLMRKKLCNEGMPIQMVQACFLWDWTKCYDTLYPGQNAKRRELK